MSHRVPSTSSVVSAALTACVVLSLWLPACGGGSSASEPKSADSADQTEPSSSASDDAPGDEESEAAAAPPQDPCADGSCFSCGKSMCLPGWYCDETAQGGPACSWQPECTTSPSCKCITKVLGSGCACTDEGGGPHVRCE